MSHAESATNAEVKGAVIDGLLDAAGDLSSVFEQNMREILADHGIELVDADEWYPLDAYLDTLSVVSEEMGAQTLKNTGKRIPEYAEWPPGIDSTSAGLEAINDAYEMNHRGGDVGFYEYEATGETAGVLTCRNPYPCAFDMGLITGVAEKFSPGSTLIDVKEQSTTCRTADGEKCTYQVSW